MAKCEGCGVEFQPRRKGHRFHSTDCRIQAQWGRKKHGPNRKALEVQITAMQAASEHAALVESCRQLADVVDAQVANSIFDDKAWREYRLALAELGKAVNAGDGSQSFQEFQASLRASIPDPAHPDSAD